jgi:hypothetical protein
MLRQLDVVAGRHGIRVDRARHYRWAAWYALEDGRRADALRNYARAVAAGDFRSLGRAGVAMIRLGYAIRRARAADPSLEQDPWIIEARAWLHELVEAERGSCGLG